ncbi:AaceriAER342Cp [[Ashbya] aceris (nom. inval.)]|nr:AaceriAER342Cp [[Ashbya] aceris (nom. inval.)]
MCQLLAIPLKMTLQVDMQGQLAAIIDSTFYQVSSVFSDDLATVSNMRDRSLLEADASAANLEALQDYCKAVFALIDKFPDRQIEFTWFETLGHKAYGKTSNLWKFELLNVIYNIGAVQSLLASSLGNDELKEACRYLQESAGCFQYILSAMDGELEALFDEKTIKAVLNLMLAQAQECCWARALRDSMKHSPIARLALQVSNFYEEAHRFARISPIIRTKMVKCINEKSYYFAAVAYYRQALYFEEKQQYGNAVRSLNEAQEKVRGAGKGPEVVLFEKELNDTLNTIQRDNDLIYLQHVPSQCPAVNPVSMVKPIQIEILTAGMQNSLLFKNLLPIDVIDSSAAFNIRQDKYVEDYVKSPLVALNKILHSSLPENEALPGMKHLTKEEFDIYAKTLADLNNFSSQLSERLRVVKSLIDGATTRQGTDTTDHPNHDDSEAIIEKYNKRLMALQGYLRQGEEITRETTQIFETIDRDLLTTKLQLAATNNPTMRKVETLTKERYDYIAEVEKKSLQNRILPKLVSYYKETGSLDFEPIFQEHLKIFKNDIEYVQLGKKRNAELISELNADEEEEGGKIRRLSPRDIQIQDFKHSLHLLEQVKENIEEGQVFYEDLKESIGSLHEDVTEFLNKKS